MGIINYAGFKNDSCDEYEIDIAFRTAERSLEALENNRAEMAAMPFAWRFYHKVSDFFLYLRLNRDLSDLVATLKTTSCTTDPTLSILVGEFLYKAERFEEAATCFGKAVEILNVPDQDIRIPALVGKLECRVARQEYLWLSGNLDARSAREARTLVELIQEDLPAVSFPLQKELDARLIRAKSSMDVLLTKIKVHCDANMLKRLGFM